MSTRRPGLARSSALRRRATTRELESAYQFLILELSEHKGWIGDEPAFLALVAWLEEELVRSGVSMDRMLKRLRCRRERSEAIAKCERVMSAERDGGKS